MTWTQFAFWLLVPPVAYLALCSLIGYWLRTPDEGDR